MGRLYGRRPRKNNKSARGQKQVWIVRKKVEVKNTDNSNSAEPMIFDDLTLEKDEVHLNCVSVDIETTDSVVLDQSSECKDEVLTRNLDELNLPLQTYKAQDFIKKRIVPTIEFGIISSDECERIENFPLEIEREPKKYLISGNRIVELQYVLNKTLEVQFNHSKICNGLIEVTKEVHNGQGLISTILFCCTKCSKQFNINTENPEKNVSDINIGAVWGTLATGSTYGHLEELFSCMDIPPMPAKIFYKLENELGEEWRSSLNRAMTEAGKREKEYAIANGHLCLDGTPYITVYVDGSWSKRSYGTNFNALSGMVGIIGRYTGELLFAGVRNKFCSICERAKNCNKQVKLHVCYKNWDSSAPAMEADLVVEGFNVSQKMHGVKYLKFIGDGDSSVFAKIKQNVSYGHQVKKIECTNHALKNYGKHLFKIKADTTINIAGRKLLTKAKILLLTKRAKCSIYEHSKQPQKDIPMLKKDLENGIHHVFGDHSNCREGTCNTIGAQTDNLVPHLKSTSIFNHLCGAMNVLIRKADLLIENENNNTAERLMNIVARFNMGKRINLIQRGSYQRRVFLSGLRYNKSFAWHSSPWKRVTGRSPGQYFKKYVERQLKHSSRPKKACKKLFSDSSSVPKTPLKNTDYGPNAEQPEEDPEIISLECARLLKNLEVTHDERNQIQANSIGQFENDLFVSERKFRLTASLFGRVIKRRAHTPCHNIVKTCLVQSTIQTDATEYGIAKEDVAIRLFEQKTNLQVEKSGLWIDLQYGFLGASPDGLVGNDSLLEIKCIYLKPDVKVNTINDVIALKKQQICLQKIRDEVKLKRNHSYFYQVQGQLNITNKSKCYFVVYVNDKVELHIEEIYRDHQFWTESMLPKLVQFYTECVGPEIIRNNIGSGKRCVDPPYILNAIQQHNEKQTKKKVV